MNVASAPTFKMASARHALGLLALAALAAALYLAWAGLGGGWGFPLDDGWIHQTYARNLAQTGRWTYTAGQVSAGSTSPLWTLLLVPGHLMGLDPRLWAYAWGLVGLWGSGWLTFRLGLALGLPQRPAWLLGGLVVCEWHLVWAALSGMETTLFICLALALVYQHHSQADGRAARRGFGAGLLAGLLVLARPDGLLLVAWIGIDILLRWTRQRSQWPGLLALAGGFLLTLMPYLLSNYLASGTLWPNTFYAKQAEYQEVLRHLSLPARFWRVLSAPWVGPQVLLLPGLLALVRPGPGSRGVAMRPLLLLAGWWLSVILVYALRLPVTYQHGRYLMPVIPAVLILGGVGSWLWLRPRAPRLLHRMASRAALLAYAATIALFLILGARAYHWDTRFIETEMVATARWLRTHTPEDALVAAHDIGAIGYFARRDLVDLAGLVSPEVIPFIRDEEALLRYVLARGADYLVTFPSWYPQMVESEHLHPVFRTDAPWAPALGGENMVVYRVGGP